MLIAIILVFILEIVITIVSLILPLIIVKYSWATANIFLIATGLGFSVYLYAIISCLISVIVYRILPQPKFGVYNISEQSAEFIKFVALLSLRLYIKKTPASWLTLLPGGTPFLRIAGSNLGSGINSACFDNILDFKGINIGNNVVLGYNSVLSCHMIVDNMLTYKTITIDDGAIIGANVLIYPDVKIGKKAIINPLSVIYPGTIIGDNEVWGGNPARRRKQANLDQND